MHLTNSRCFNLLGILIAAKADTVIEAAHMLNYDLIDMCAAGIMNRLRAFEGALLLTQRFWASAYA